MKDLNAVNCFAALGHPTRLSVFRALVQAGREGVPVGTLSETLEIPGSTLTHHLQALIRAGLAHQERQGRVLVTRADYDAMSNLINFLTDDCCKGMPASKAKRSVSS